jgi:hypothetical protein
MENDYKGLYEIDTAGWIMAKCDQWRDHYESNYAEKFEEYYRLWRGIWDPSDSLRNSERSRIISPALQQAVESSVAEVEEATFGRGRFFDIRDDLQDQNKDDIVLLRNQLDEDFARTKIRKAVSEALINSAVFGTGVAEMVVEEMKESVPATRPVMEGAMTAVGIETRDRFVVKLKPVLPQNFLIDPVATSIDEALGVAIDEFVSRHQVEMLIENGTYRDVILENTYPDVDLEPDQDLTIYDDDKVRLTKYYGLVPRYLFDAEMAEELADDEEVADLVETEDVEDATGYVEVVAVIANGGQLLKIESNPYMMQDRPVVAFSWDVVPGRFWGRGVCEKGYNSQKALDTELRARIDALALTIHPMLAVDASRLPRGAKMEIRPGKTILTNGNPAEILQPFNFGNVSQITFAQAAQLQTMVQQATGAVDSAGMQGVVNGEATAAGISMGLGAIIKRHKRTLINFQDSFLIPMIEKSAWRYMQFAPELYPVQDFKFIPSSSLGIIAREYEVTQLVQLLQTMDKSSPMYPMLLEAIIDHMNISNREELIGTLRQASQPNPEAQQAQQQQAQMQMEQLQAQIAAFNGQAQEAQARAQKYISDIDLDKYEAETDRIKALSSNLQPGDEDDKEFQRRAKTAELYLKEQELNMKASQGVRNADQNRNAENSRPDQRQVQPTGQTPQGLGTTIPTPDQEFRQNQGQ